jgi:hypothetical protein
MGRAVSDITPAREALEVAICEGLGRAWRAALACLAADPRGITFGYPEVRAEAGKVLAASEAYAADEVMRAAEMTLRKAREAEEALAAAEARLEGARRCIGNFLARYGDSDILMFKVGRDLASSLLAVLGDSGRAGVPRA